MGSQQWIKKWGREQNSSLWTRDPLYYKLWNYLLYNCKNGVYKGNYPDIEEGISWLVKGNPEVPNRAKVRYMLEWFESQDMITVEGSQGKDVTITICKWTKYQGGEGNAPVMQPKVTPKKDKVPNKSVTRLIAYYMKNVDPDSSNGIGVRRSVYTKLSKWGGENLKNGIDEFVRRCDLNVSLNDRMRYKGANYWFRFVCDEYVTLAKRRKETNDTGSQWLG
jgi:hypothetical protein